MIWMWIALSIGAVGFPRAQETYAPSLFSSDLAFQFICKNKARTALEDDIAMFLKRAGFRVLNLGRIQREHNVFLLDLNIIGLDDKQRMIDIISLPTAEGRYAATLRTPPPTHRLPDLEESLLKFTSDELGCEVRQVTRGQNGTDARAFYDNEITRIENLFREAEALQGLRQL